MKVRILPEEVFKLYGDELKQQLFSIRNQVILISLQGKN